VTGLFVSEIQTRHEIQSIAGLQYIGSVHIKLQIPTVILV